MPSWINTWFNDSMRKALWAVVKLILWMMDGIYGIINNLFGLNLSDNFSWIWAWFRALCGFLVLFIIIRLILMYLKTIWDEDAAEHIDGLAIIRKMVGIALIILLLPVGLPALSKLSADMTTKFPSLVNMQEIAPSDVILEAGLIDMSKAADTAQTTDPVAAAKSEAGIDANASLVDFLTEDTINDKTGDKKYKYFPDWSNLLLTGVLSGMSVYCLIYVALQIASRTISLLFKVLLAPYALSGMVDPKDTSTATWFKLCMADLLGNFFQMALIWMVLFTCANIQLTGLTKGIFFIGALFAIMNAPTGVAQIIGSDIGTSSGIQSLAQLKAFSGALRSGGAAGIAMAGAAGGTMLTTGAGAVYGIGRMKGNTSMNPLMQGIQAFAGGGNSGDSTNTGSSGSGGFGGGIGGSLGDAGATVSGQSGSPSILGEESSSYEGTNNLGVESPIMNDQGGPGIVLTGTDGSYNAVSLSGGTSRNVSSASGGMARAYGQAIYEAAGKRWNQSRSGGTSLRAYPSQVARAAGAAAKTAYQGNVAARQKRVSDIANRIG